MAGFYEQKNSRAANWCLKLAIFAVPFFILTVYLHRAKAIGTEQAFWLLAFGIAIVVAAILFGLRAAIDLWERGYKGGRKTVNGLALSALLLAPFGYQLVLALENPKLNDISTDIVDPPKFIEVEKLSNYSPSFNIYDGQQLASAYPEVTSRPYNAPTDRVYISAKQILKSWNWKIIESINAPKEKTDIETETELDGAEPEVADGPQEIILLQVSAKSMIMKLDSELMIRLSPEDEITIVDVRARSEWSPHDFGSNAKNIVAFLDALDLALAGVAGEI